MRKIFLFLLFLLNFTCYVAAQQPYTISGEIINRNSKAIPFANVALYSKTDSLMLKGVSSDENGKFSIEAVQPGTYYLSVFFIGFQSSTVSDVSITNENIHLNKIELRRKRTQLEEITVVSEKGMFENQAGKMVYNVDGNISATGELADELLQNIPSVSVDMDNKVTVRGAKATVLIDGIESSLADMLDQIPADAIESIEVITNPSVRYESKQGGSIINIILKKQAGKGYNGKVALGAGTSEKRDVNINLGQNNKKWRYSAAFNLQHKLQENETNSKRITEKANAVNLLTQEQMQQTTTSSQFASAVASRFFEDKSFVSFTYTLQNRNQDKNSETQSKNFQEDLQTSNNKISRTGNNDNTFHQFQSNFKDILKKGLLEGSLLYSCNAPLDEYIQITQAIDMGTQEPDLDYRVNEKRYDNSIQLLKTQIDFSRKLAAKTNLETGVQYTYNYFGQNLLNKRTSYKPDGDSGINYGTEDVFESEFTNRNQSAAAYVLLSSNFKKYSFSAGTRLEYMHNAAFSDSTVTSSYFKFIPSVHIKNQVSEKYTWEVSFTARTTPPTYNQLNPISLSWGNYSKSSGNPNLKPELFYQFEWSNSWQLEKSNFVASLFFRNQSDIIGKWYYIEIEDEKQVSHSVFENLGELRTAGIDVSSMFTYGKFKIRPSLVTFYNCIKGNKFASTLDREEVSYTLKIAGNYQVNKKVNIQCTGNYYSPFISVYGKQYGYYKVDAGIRAKIMKNKGALSLKVMDIFDSSEYDKTVNQREDMLRTSHINPKSFLVYMNFSYQFNSLKRAVAKKG
jgi:hypothetical protein